MEEVVHRSPLPKAVPKALPPRFGLVVAEQGGPGGSARAEPGPLSGAPGRAGQPPRLLQARQRI